MSAYVAKPIAAASHWNTTLTCAGKLGSLCLVYSIARLQRTMRGNVRKGNDAFADYLILQYDVYAEADARFFNVVGRQSHCRLSCVGQFPFSKCFTLHESTEGHGSRAIAGRLPNANETAMGPNRVASTGTIDRQGRFKMSKFLNLPKRGRTITTTPPCLRTSSFLCL